MCLSCRSKRIWSFLQNRMTGYPIKFDHNEAQELQKKYQKISGTRQTINKASFQQNMGILGLNSAYGFSDRLFNSFDIDKDGTISFQDFLEYMEVLKCGNEKNKAKISFSLIDLKNRNKVDIDDFKDFLNDYFRSWTSITNSIITPEIIEQTDIYVEDIFTKVRQVTKKNYIDFPYYAQKLHCDTEFMEAFQFITEGVANMFISTRLNDQNCDDSKILHQLLKELNAIVDMMDDSKKEQEISEMKMKRSGSRRSHKVQVPSQFMEEEYPPKQEPSPFFKKKQLNKEAYEKMKENSTKEYEKTKLEMESIEFHCKKCLTFQVIEKKAEFLLNKLKNIVQETKEVYERLNEKFFTMKNTKRETAGNVHNYIARQGDMVFFGDDNWNIVLNMMIGIQMAVRSVRGYQEMIYQEPKDFNLKYYFQLVPRRFGDEEENYTQICSFTDYAPQTFNHIRRIFKIDNEEYVQSIGPTKLMASLIMGEVNSMTSLTSQGKSGSFFYYTVDGKYLLKTIQYREYRFFRSILQDYYLHLKKNPGSLITKFYGLHKLIEKDQNGDIKNKTYFVIMANVFNTKDKIVERFDIKGSWYGRENSDPHPNATKKDNDFKKRKPLDVGVEDRQILMETIRKDAEFFRVHNIIDYSLLIGVIKNEQQHKQDRMFSSKMVNGSEDSAYRETKYFYNSCSSQSYIFGIIDVFTEYSTRKAMEHYFKRIFYGQGISAVPPDEYSERFVNFIDQTVFRRKQSHSMDLMNANQSHPKMVKQKL